MKFSKIGQASPNGAINPKKSSNILGVRAPFDVRILVQIYDQRISLPNFGQVFPKGAR